MEIIAAAARQYLAGGAQGLILLPVPRRTVITIGNFDGVHLGHAALVSAARRVAERSALGHSGPAVTVLSFDPSPITLLQPGKAPPRLSQFTQREQWLRRAGADDIVALRPTPGLLDLTAERFLNTLVEQYRPVAIVEGPDFRFGRARGGSIALLRELESRFGYETIVVDPVEAVLSDQNLVRVSSTLVRWLLMHGRVRDAMVLLGRPYELRCQVVRGDRRGRTIGVPTANLDQLDQLLPGDGIYAGLAERPDGRRFPAAISVGTKPTFGQHPRTCEAHLLGYSGPLDDYGWTIRLEFHHWLRDQLIYHEVDALIDQLQRDIQLTGKLMQTQAVHAVAAA